MVYHMESKMVYYATEIEKKNQELQHSLEYYEGRLSCNVRYITFYKSDLDPLKAQLETLHTLCKELLTTLYNFDVGNSYLRGESSRPFEILSAAVDTFSFIIMTGIGVVPESRSQQMFTGTLLSLRLGNVNRRTACYMPSHRRTPTSRCSTQS